MNLEGILFVDAIPVVAGDKAEAARFRSRCREDAICSLDSIATVAGLLVKKMESHGTEILDIGDWVDVRAEAHDVILDLMDTLSVIETAIAK